MKARSVLLSVMIAAVLGSSTAALGQVKVDARGPIRNRLRNPTEGHGGSIGRKLPLQVTIQIHVLPDTRTTGEIEFVLTNVGSTNLVIPVSPQPADFEPANPSLSYTVKHLSLSLTSQEGRPAAVVGGADLFGRQTLPETLTVLAPGNTLVVLARVKLPPSGSREAAEPIVARVSLSDETIRTVDGRTSVDAEEIGSASSAQYTLPSLPKREP